MKVSQAVELYNNFGFDVAFSSVCASRFKSASDYRNRNILKYLKEEYKDFISEYQRKNYDANAGNKNSKTIWTLWLQGDSPEVQPDVVRMCLKNMEKNCGSHPLPEKHGKELRLPPFENLNRGQLSRVCRHPRIHY